jgi:hypothetical protein
MPRRAERTDNKFINQCLMLAARWQQVGPGTIGLTDADRDAFAALAAQARADAAHAIAMREAARGATTTKNATLKRLRTIFSALTKRIEGFALTSPNPVSVYVAAQIGESDRPSPLPVPEAPIPLGVALLADGSARVSFAGRFEGAMMQVQRAVNAVGRGDGAYELLGVFGEGSFIDLYPPPGAGSIHYRARLARYNGRKSPWSQPAVMTFGRARPNTTGEVALPAGGKAAGAAA